MPSEMKSECDKLFKKYGNDGVDKKSLLHATWNPVNTPQSKVSPSKHGSVSRRKGSSEVKQNETRRQVSTEVKQANKRRQGSEERQNETESRKRRRQGSTEFKLDETQDSSNGYEVRQDKPELSQQGSEITVENAVEQDETSQGRITVEYDIKQDEAEFDRVHGPKAFMKYAQKYFITNFEVENMLTRAVQQMKMPNDSKPKIAFRESERKNEQSFENIGKQQLNYLLELNFAPDHYLLEGEEKEIKAENMKRLEKQLKLPLDMKPPMAFDETDTNGQLDEKADYQIKYMNHYTHYYA